jgi:NAD-dependent DNA ligase
VSAHTNLSNYFPLENMTFCLTGEFVSASRNTIAKKLKERGAIEKSAVSVNLDYLFVGGMATGVWKFGNTNSKIKRAMELQEEGARVLIVAEEELEGVVINK